MFKSKIIDKWAIMAIIHSYISLLEGECEEISVLRYDEVCMHLDPLSVKNYW